MNLKPRREPKNNLFAASFRIRTLGLLAVSLFATGGLHADIATYFDESTLPDNLYLDVPNTSVGTITLEPSLSRLLFFGPGADMWWSRNGIPFAWTPVPNVGIGGSWEAETEVEYCDNVVASHLAGMTLYSGPDGAGGANFGQEFTFSLDHWDAPNGVWIQGLGDNRPGDSANLSSALTTDKVTLRMVASRGSKNYNTYTFYYRLTTNDTWSSVGTIHHTASFSRVALFFKGSKMNVAFNHFLVTTLSPGLQYACTTNANNTLTIIEYTGSESNLVVPDQIDGLPVSGIGNNAFSNCGSLTNVTIPSGVTSIGNSAFYNCNSLTSVSIPSGVTTIGNYAFYNCTQLSHVVLPESVNTLGEGAFFYCRSLTSITLPNDMTTIAGYAFYECSSLTNMVIPDSVTSLGSSIFNGCGNLTTVTLPKDLTMLPDSIFYNCSSLTNIVIPEHVTTLEYNAFFNCTSLKTLTIPDTVIAIGDSALSYCTSLTNVVIPGSVTSIGYNAFESCTALTRITIPDTVTWIGDSAFFNCNNLTSVTLPSSLTYLPYEAFGYCFNLRAIYLKGNPPDMDWSAFDMDSDFVFYYLPSATGWENFSANMGIPARLWNPTIQAGTQGFGPLASGYYFNIAGTPDIPIQVDACTNLTEACWTPLLTTSLINGSLDFTDAASTNFPVRFYRIIGP